MESTNRTGYKCLICKKPDPPNARNAACNEDETIDWWQCGACTGWYHEVCLDDPQHALGDAWCPQCEQRSAEDSIGLGDFGQHGATRLNYTLQGVGEDVLACINAANPDRPPPGRRQQPGMVPKMVRQLLDECDSECRLLGSSRTSLMGILGGSGMGKTVILNCLMLGSSDKVYLPDAPSLAPEKMIRQQLQHLKACGYVTQDLLASGGNAVTTWNPQEDHTSFGRAAFGRDGLLLEAQRQQLLGADAAAKAGLVDAFISGQPLPQHQGSLLPVFQHGRGREVTSCQNVVVMKGSRVRVLMLPFSARLLHEVVMTCKRKAQELSGYSLEQEALDVLFPGTELANLSETPRGLQKQLNPALRKCMRLGEAVDVVLPNKSRQHDLLFVQQLLRRLCGIEGAPGAPQAAGGPIREAWTYLIWQVYVFIDDGPLPPSKGLMDVPGEDESPMRAVIRSEGFKQVDSLMMVLDKTFLAAGPGSALHMLWNGAGEQARLKERIVQGEVSLLVVMNERSWSSYKDMDTSRHALETDYERYAKRNRDHLAAVLRSKVQQDQDKASMQALADSTPILMYRPMVAAAILLAVAAGKLSVDDTLKSRLEATGQLALFKALGSNSRASVLPYIQRCMGRMQRIDALGQFVKNAAMKNAAMNSTVAELEEQKQLLDKLMPHLAEHARIDKPAFKHPSKAKQLQELLRKQSMRNNPGAEFMPPDMECYSKLRGVWLTEGKHKVEQLLNDSCSFLSGSSQMQLPEDLKSVEQCKEFGRQLQVMRQDVQDGTCLLLQPMLDWTEKVGLECLTPLIEAVATMQHRRLQYAVQQLQEQGEGLPEGSMAAIVVQMYLQHVLPAMTYTPSMATDSRGIGQKLLRSVRTELLALMVAKLDRLLGELKGTVRQHETKLGAAGAAAAAAAGDAAGRAPAPESSLKVTADCCQPKQLLMRVVECSLPEQAPNGSTPELFTRSLQTMLVAEVDKLVVAEPTPELDMLTAAETVKRLAADMLLLSNSKAAAEFAEHTVWLTCKVDTITSFLNQHGEKAAQQATELLLLQHQHRRLVAKYSISSIVLFDSTPLPGGWEEFTELAEMRDTVVEMGSSEWRKQLPPGMQVQQEHSVNVKRICEEFAAHAVGLEGKVFDVASNAPGEGRALLLSEHRHQSQALHDLLSVHLLSITQRELQMGKDHQMQRLTGITACQAMISGALQHDPWVVLAVLSLLTGNMLHVLVQGDAASGAAAAAAAAAAPAGSVDTADAAAALVQLAQASQARRTSSAAAASTSTGGRSKQSNRKRDRPSSTVIVKIDAVKGSDNAPLRYSLPAAAAAGGRATRRSSEAAALGMCRRVTSLRLLLRGGEWRVEVLSSRLVGRQLARKDESRPGMCALRLGGELLPAREPLNNYVECALCAAEVAPELHCRSCHFSAHRRHLPVGQQPQRGGARWQCKVCSLRGLA